MSFRMSMSFHHRRVTLPVLRVLLQLLRELVAFEDYKLSLLRATFLPKIFPRRFYGAFVRKRCHFHAHRPGPPWKESFHQFGIVNALHWEGGTLISAGRIAFFCANLGFLL